MVEPQDDEILLRKVENGLFVSVPNSAIPDLNDWVAWLQAELDKPIEIPEVVLAQVMVSDKLKAQTPPRDTDSLTDDEYCELLKAEVVRVFEMVHKTTDRQTDQPDDVC